jgi:hypothetical protein
MALQAIPISSSLIGAMVYDDETGELHVTFKSSGATWVYGNEADPVPQEEVDAIVNGGGSYFLSDVRDSYPARRA